VANQEHIERLLDGVEGWNKWRQENLLVRIDLSGADFRDIVLSGAHLYGANLEEASLRRTNLKAADLRKTDLSGANLFGANLTEANLGGANLNGSNLVGTILCKANLGGTDFNGANLAGVKIGEALLRSTNLVNVDLSQVDYLDEAKHYGPSHISVDTLQLSKGKISEKFLKGCGLSDWEIESAKLYQERLSTKEIDDILYRVHDLRAGQSMQLNPLFISYSHKDSTFIDCIEKHLDERGVRFWRDIHDATAGRLEKVVDWAIRQNSTVLLVLSENSVQSDWVEHEARSARGLEKELKRDVLCPVALDDAWKDCAWPKRLREQIEEYHVLDFSKWKDPVEFAKMFRKLIDGLDLFYKEK
jgi:uncharacterized protein YjbI with pentapeptide repeats